MAARLSGLIVLALLSGAPAVSAQAAAGQVIPPETLHRAGVGRISEILLLAHWWDIETVDGFTWRASPLGGSPLLPARWTVVVDGRRMSADLFGIADLDRLGVSLGRIAEVELIEMPRLAAGRITSDGVIRITTVRPQPGPSADGWFTTGSEIGDPGPFAFTPERSRNVDRLGHTASAGLSYGGSGWYADGTVNWARLVPGDEAIAGRYRAALGPAPRLRSTSPAVRVGWRTGSGRHEAVLRHSIVDGALGLSPFGLEIPSEERFTQVGLAGEVPAGRGRAVSYDVSHTWKAAQNRRGAPGPPLDWSGGETEARVELGNADEPVGLRVHRVEVSTPSGLEDPIVLLGTGYGSVRLDPTTTASASVTLGEGDAGVAALLSRRWAVSDSTALDGVLSFERASRGEDNTIWAWTGRGYDLLEEGGADFAIVGEPRSPARMGVDVGMRTSGARGLAWTARALFRRDRGLSLESRELHFVPATESFDGPTTLVRGAGGEIAGVAAGLEAQPISGIVIAASYWIRGAVGGDSVYRNTWATVARHGGRATVEYVPVPGLELWWAAAYRGPSRHVELRAVEAESGGRYRERVEDAFTLDLALQKLFWDGRLRAHLSIRNVLGAELRYHPAGAAFGPTAVLQLEGRLP